MRRLLFASVTCLVTSLAVASAQAATATPRVLGGAATSIQAAPWQVGIFASITANAGQDKSHANEPPDSPPFSFECGGVILDATHVLTAAHCVHVYTDDFASPFDGQLSRDGESYTYKVISGTSFRSAGDAHFAKSDVTSIARDPMYDGINYDVAIMTVSPALDLDGVNRAAIALAPGIPAAGTALSVTGWGLNAATAPALMDALQTATVNVTDFSQCQLGYRSAKLALTDGASLCAVGAGPVRDTCTGDDGGPLVANSGTPQLVGVIASGVGCAQAQLPGVYTSVANPFVRDFITAYTTGPIPDLLVPQFGAVTPWLSGVLKEGQTLTCAPGDWFNNPVYEFTFIDPNSGGVTLQTATGPTAQYIVQASDVGHDIVCRARAANIQGSLNIKSNPVGPASAITTSPTQTQTPTTTQTTTTKTTTTTTKGTTGVDKTKPRAVVTATKCTAKRCVLHVAAADSGFSAGIKSLSGTVRTTVTKRCGSRTCSHTVTSKLKITTLKTNGYFLVTASNLPRGKHRFSFTAVDRAGNKQTKATVKTVSTPTARSTK
jgi:hypothetical protein